MKKLIEGILEFRLNHRHEYREKFCHLKAKQSPDALMVACCDSRVAPNVFASSDPGDLVVLRNMGNIIPSLEYSKDNPTMDALKFGVLQLSVKDIVICGHSNCGAIRAFLDSKKTGQPCPYASLENIERTFIQLEKFPGLTAPLVSYEDSVSQANVISQVEHLETHPFIEDKIKKGELRIHAWWFDLDSAIVSHFRYDLGVFREIDEVEASRLFQKSGKLLSFDRYLSL